MKHIGKKRERREGGGRGLTSSCPRLSLRSPVSSLKVTSLCEPNDTALNLRNQAKFKHIIKTTTYCYSL